MRETISVQCSCGRDLKIPREDSAELFDWPLWGQAAWIPLAILGLEPDTVTHEKLRANFSVDLLVEAMDSAYGGELTKWIAEELGISCYQCDWLSYIKSVDEESRAIFDEEPDCICGEHSAMRALITSVTLELQDLGVSYEEVIDNFADYSGSFRELSSPGGAWEPKWRAALSAAKAKLIWSKL